MSEKPDDRHLIDVFRNELEEEKPELLNPFSILFEKICTVRNVPDIPPSLQKEREKVRIALVSMPEFALTLTPFSSLRDATEPPALDHAACARRLVAFHGDVCNRMLEAFSEALNAALLDGANVVCFSELGFPSQEMKPMLEAGRLACEASKQHDALIIAGSVHDSRTLYNTAYLFHPGCSDNGVGFHKSISAVSAKELISAPAARSVPLVNIFGLRIASMICLDIADYASIASVVRCADRVDVLLVPCYTKRFEKMAEIAKVASEALPGLVALVNAKRPRETAGLHQIWRLGEKLEPETKKLSSGGFISYLELDADKFRQDRIQWKTSKEKNLTWLFGSRDRPALYT